MSRHIVLVSPYPTLGVIFLFVYASNALLVWRSTAKHCVLRWFGIWVFVILFGLMLWVLDWWTRNVVLGISTLVFCFGMPSFCRYRRLGVYRWVLFLSIVRSRVIRNIQRMRAMGWRASVFLGIMTLAICFVMFAGVSAASHCRLSLVYPVPTSFPPFV